MNLQDIINRCRERLNDEKGLDSQKLWSISELVSYATEAEQEIARRLEILKDSDTIGYIVLDGTVGQIDSVSVSGVVITSAAVPFAANLSITAANLSVIINSQSSTPDYRAVVRGSLVIIKAVPRTGYPAGGYSLTASASGGLTAVCTNLPGLCRQVVAIGQRYLALDQRILRITRFKPSGQTKPVPSTTKDNMDITYPAWEELENGTIFCHLPDYDSNETIVVPGPAAVELIEQDVVRLPLVDFSVSDLKALPEIAARYHEAMIERMMRNAYRKDDVDTQDMVKSKTHEGEFDLKIEGWKVQDIRRSPAPSVNQIPGGLM